MDKGFIHIHKHDVVACFAKKLTNKGPSYLTSTEYENAFFSH